MSTMNGHCGQQTLDLSRESATPNPFTVFYGSLTRIPTPANRTAVGTIPVVQFLGPNPRRIALEIWANPSLIADVLISTVQSPGSYLQTFLVENNNTPLIIFPGDFLVSAFYACYEAPAPAAPDGLAITGWEWVLA